MNQVYYKDTKVKYTNITTTYKENLNEKYIQK